MNYILYNIYTYKHKAKKKKKWRVSLICRTYFSRSSSYLFPAFTFFHAVDYCDKQLGHMLPWEATIWRENYSKPSSVWFLTIGNSLMCRVSINAYTKNDRLMIADKGRVNNARPGSKRDRYFLRVAKNVNLSHDCTLCAWAIAIFRNGKCNL